MLKLDAETRDIPILTYTPDGEDPETEDESPEPFDSEIFAPRPAKRMN